MLPSIDSNGKRSRTAFVAVRDFGAPQLQSDYRFLEDAPRVGDLAHRLLGSGCGGGSNTMRAAQSQAPPARQLVRQVRRAAYRVVSAQRTAGAQ